MSGFIFNYFFNRKQRGEPISWQPVNTTFHIGFKVEKRSEVHDFY